MVLAIAFGTYLLLAIVTYGICIGKLKVRKGPKEMWNFEWTCEWPGCHEIIHAMTDSGMSTLRQFHMESHYRAGRGETKNYDELKLTPYDEAFLSTLKVSK